LNNQGGGILKCWVGNKRVWESQEKCKKILRVYSENRKKPTKCGTSIRQTTHLMQ